MGKVAVEERRLIAHPAAAGVALRAVAVRVGRGEGDTLLLDYRVSPAAGVSIPAVAAPRRADDLWRSTCFELFARPAGDAGYFEFNFAPSRAWAAYGFADYRAGRQDIDVAAPAISVSADGDALRVAVALALPVGARGALSLGCSAVIEEGDGTLSYWALAHPAGRPDFHDRACFALELPAAG